MKNNKTIPTRESYGKALEYLGEIYENLVVLDADLSSATKTIYFKNKFPERHINCGIAEANMTGIAAGLSLTGLVPIISSFAMFATGRNFEQIRNTICYPHLNVKIVATHAGITVGEDGATHQSIEDIALMRAIPGMTVIEPCDDYQTRLAIEAAIRYIGPVYIRLGRAPVPGVIRTKEPIFRIGEGIKLREGNDLTIIATGIGVNIALQLRDEYDQYGISVEVINIHTIKPIDDMLVYHSAVKTRKVVTIEEHSVIGGLGDAVADVLVKYNCAKMLKIGIDDCFGTSGTSKDLLKIFGLELGTCMKKINDFFYINLDTNSHVG